MNNLFHLGPLLSTSLAMLLVLVGNAFFSNNNMSSNADLESILGLIDEGEYIGAIDQLHIELDNDQDNPDILSLLGYSYRKVLNYEDALTFYQSALRVEPEHMEPTSIWVNCMSKPVNSTKRKVSWSYSIV